ncbi:ankyrin repeat-containing domain protein [Mycena alexandri]|uniref:Ankyrin repeat-containing domain protein n=1 Tax=Mycena alexandri TaxID=1745969 RepID=A0AAD6T9L1_9AGAR|nr:ankyrin repeat-containing domain protein [Mycena alexandri]
MIVVPHTSFIIHTGKDGDTPLHLVSLNGHSDVAKLLIEKGADISVKREDGNMPLHFASWNGHTDIAKLLIEKGADISVKRKNGDTPLHRALLRGHTDVAKLLIEKGADIDAIRMYPASFSPRLVHPLHRLQWGHAAAFCVMEW